MTRVLVADDHPLFREGVARSLSENGYTVVAEAQTGREAVELAATTAPDLVLLDLSMPDGGLWALERIAALSPRPLVAMLTVSEEDENVLAALETGAAGYILKGVGSRDLLRIIGDLLAGRSYVAPSLAAKVLTRMNAPRQTAVADDPVDTLTRREEDILRLVARGLSNKEVGRELDLQEKTVKHYMTTILQKLQVRNRTEAALLAHDRWSDR